MKSEIHELTIDELESASGGRNMSPYEVTEPGLIVDSSRPVERWSALEPPPARSASSSRNCAAIASPEAASVGGLFHW